MVSTSLVKGPQYNVGNGSAVARRKVNEAAKLQRLRRKIIRSKIKEVSLEFQCEKSSQAAKQTLARLAHADALAVSKASMEFPGLRHTLSHTLAQHGHVVMVLHNETRFYADGHHYTMPKTLTLRDPSTLEILADVAWRKR